MAEFLWNEDVEKARKTQEEHKRMLDFLKREFSPRGFAGTGLTGRTDVWELIHGIDPAWENPWNDPDDPEGRCICGPIGIKLDCPIHGDEREDGNEPGDLSPDDERLQDGLRRDDHG